MSVVRIKDLVKDYKSTKALQGISFEINEGEIFGLIGPNGAGKSTTLKIISTLLNPSSGIVEVFDNDVKKRPGNVRELISYLPEEAGAYKNLSGVEYLRFMANFYSKSSKDIQKMVDLGREISDLGERIDDKVSTYSKGMKRKLLLGRALMVRPKLAILDEPASGLDIINAYSIRQTIRRFAKNEGITFLISSHNMLEVEFVCDRVALINDGLIVELGTPGELKNKYGAKNLEDVFMTAIKGEKDFISEVMV